MGKKTAGQGGYLVPCLNLLIPIPSMYGHIHLHGWLIFMVHVGKYTSPMDGMGYIINIYIYIAGNYILVVVGSINYLTYSG